MPMNKTLNDYDSRWLPPLTHATTQPTKGTHTNKQELSERRHMKKPLDMEEIDLIERVVDELDDTTYRRMIKDLIYTARYYMKPTKETDTQ